MTATSLLLAGGTKRRRCFRERLSPPSLHQRNNASTYHDKNDDDGKRLRQAQGPATVIPKLKHAPASIQSAPRTEKDITSRKHMMAKAHAVATNATFGRAWFDRAAK
jgi:hypothetical protein